MELVYFALLISVLIFVHELGHFVFAKAFGVKVLTFSLGFGPKILRLRGRETEYCVGLLPLGGFVKMLEETRQEPVLPEDKKRTFEAQSLPKRFVIVLAGPVMNLLFPVLLYFAVFLGDTEYSPPTIGQVLPGHPAEGKLAAGDRVLEVDGQRISTFAELRRLVAASPGREVRLKIFRDNQHLEVPIVPEEKIVQRPLDLVDRVGEIGVMPSRPAAVVGVSRVDSPAYRAGLRTFDVVTEVRGLPVRSFADLDAALHANRGETVPVTYLRPVRVPGALGALGDLYVYESGVAALTPESTAGDLASRTGFEHADLYVAEVTPGSPEWEAGLRPGDRLLQIDATEIFAWTTFVDRLFAAPDRPHAVAWSRGGERMTGVVRLQRETWRDELGGQMPRFLLQAKTWQPVVAEPPVPLASPIRFAVQSALEETYDVVRFIVVGGLRIVQGKVSLATLGGPITVYDVVGEESAKGVGYFVWAMAVISINLGLLNLLPIPVLDGGHLVFLAFEALLRRPLPLRVREIASLVGLVVLVGIMGIAFKNDVERRWDVLRGQVGELVG